MQIEDLYQIYLAHPSVQTDSRKIKKGDLFFSLKGENFNGNEFASHTLESGAAYAIIDDKKYASDKTILVDDVLQTLQLLAQHHRKQFRATPFLAITGSNGKTTTKELIHAVLSSKYVTYTTEGNLNNHIGIPLTILKIKKDAEMAVIEMGANHLKEIESYCKVALPTHGLITNVGKAHLEGFGGEEGVRKGKGELFDYLGQHNGTAFVYQDAPFLNEMANGIDTLFTYGTNTGHVQARRTKAEHFLQIKFIKGLQGIVTTQLVGDYNFSNVLAAAAVGKFFGVEDEKIKSAIENYTPSNSRSQLMNKGSHSIVLDAYNANPSSMKAAIENFSKMDLAHLTGKILVLGAMAELGKESEAEHLEIINEIKRHSWEQVLLVGNDFEKTGHHFLQFATPQQAGEWLKKNDPERKLILLKGSRSMAMEKVLEYL